MSGEYERDEAFEVFVDDFGERTYPIDADPAVIEKYRGRLPDQLITYWENEGWGAWKDGLFWVVNPDDYTAVLEAWIADTPLEGADQWHVIARSAFGKLFLFGESVGAGVKIDAITNQCTASKSHLRTKKEDDLNEDIRSFFAFSDPDYLDEEDIDEKPLFKRALKKLGCLEPNEMYGFDHALVAGGPNTLDNLTKVEIEPYLLMLRDLGGPMAFPFFGYDFDALASEALKD